jgi:diguanylate cyclase (GGDEF)-like protein
MALRTLLVIDDDEVDRKAVARALKILGRDYELREACEGRQGVEMALSQAFDCILVDFHLPDMNGLDLLVELRERLEIPVPIVMLTGEGNEFVAVEAMKRGAHDYLPKAQLAPDTLFRAISHAVEKHELQRQLVESQDRLERLALYDTLTGLGNRNLFHLELVRAMAISRRNGTSFLLLAMDLDKFKAINDGFGHEAGDTILAAVGERLRTSARAADAYFRPGGDEFAAILEAGSDGPAAARRIRAAIAAPVPFGAHELHIGVSIGMAEYPGDGMSAADLIRAADAAMYQGKRSAQGWAMAVETAPVVRRPP